MEKHLVYLFSDGFDYNNVVFTDLPGITEWIKADCEHVSEEDAKDREYTVTLAFMTTDEINNLPELD